MRTLNDLYAIIDLLGAVPGLLLGIFIWRKGSHNRLLAAGLLAYSGLLGGMGLTRFGLMALTKPGNLLLNTMVHAAWPLFFLYIRAVARGDATLSARQVYHAVPLAVYLCGAVLPSLLFAGSFEVVYVAAMAFTGIVATGYSIAMLVELTRSRRRSLSYFSDTSRLKFSWITVNICLWFFVVVAQVLLLAIRSTGWGRPPVFEVVHGLMINLVTASWVYVIGYYALNEPNIWKISEEMNRELDKVEDVQVDCVEDAPTAQSHSAPIIEKLAQVMATDKPYLDELLTLAKLAKQVGVPAYLLGKVINRDLSKNFVTYVNEHRVRLAQELLRDPDQAEARVVDIAFNCGFRTKSAFNDSFRKITGTTPSEYRKAGVGRRSSVEISHS